MVWHFNSQLTGYAISPQYFEVSCPRKESMWHATSLIHFKNTPAIGLQWGKFSNLYCNLQLAQPSCEHGSERTIVRTRLEKTLWTLKQLFISCDYVGLKFLSNRTFCCLCLYSFFYKMFYLGLIVVIPFLQISCDFLIVICIYKAAYFMNGSYVRHMLTIWDQPKFCLLCHATCVHILL